jgi:cobaltochelatase CobS
VIRPHPGFRLFSTTNTVGLGDTTGLYHGTQQINQGQMDRWNIVTTLNYLPHDDEVKCDEAERPTVAEYYQRCFGIDLPASAIRNVAVT